MGSTSNEALLIRRPFQRIIFDDLPRDRQDRSVFESCQMLWRRLRSLICRGIDAAIDMVRIKRIGKYGGRRFGQMTVFRMISHGNTQTETDCVFRISV